MKRKIELLLLLALVLLASGCINRSGSNETPLSAGDHTLNLFHQGKTRTYLLHIPSSYEGKNALPLVINFHGGGGNAGGHVKITKMNDAADKYGFAVAYPEGTREDGKNIHLIQFWNIGNTLTGQYRTGTEVEKTNDVDFTRKLIEDVSEKINLDEKSVYATGLSNGGMFTYTLACHLSDKIAAIAPVSGPFQNLAEECQPSRNVPIMHFHGTADIFAPYEGGAPSCAPVANEEIRSVEETISIWSEKNECGSESKTTYEKGDAICKTTACGGNTQITLCTIEEGGHTWPGGNSYFFPACESGKVSSDISANEEMWKFFSQYEI